MKKLLSTFLLTACLSVPGFGIPVAAPASPGSQVMRVEAENLYDYEVVRPTADVEQFYDFEAQFPTSKNSIGMLSMHSTQNISKYSLTASCIPMTICSSTPQTTASELI